jgi:YggT family protein
MPIFSQLVDVLARTLMIYSVFLLVRVLLSWFPNLDWGSNPILSGISSITDPYLNLFRGLIPPLGGIDLSAFVAFLALNLVQSLLEQGKMLLASSGLG